MKCFIILSTILFLSWHDVASQQLTSVKFTPRLGSEMVKLGSDSKMKNGESLRFTKIKFYISKIEFLNNNKIVYTEENSFHLVDAAVPKTMTLQFLLPTKISFNKIQFNLGIDSATNYSGALGGELDPTLGMYWTWQNGYINIKIEGTIHKNQSTQKEFQFHLGGYQYPVNSLQKVSLACDQKELLEIELNLEKWFSELPNSSSYQVMSPGKEAVKYSESLAKEFIIISN